MNNDIKILIGIFLLALIINPYLEGVAGLLFLLGLVVSLVVSLKRGFTKRGIVGGIWGLIAVIGFGLQHSGSPYFLTYNFSFPNPLSASSGIIYDILFLPAILATKFFLVPHFLSLFLFPIGSILFGALIGSIIGFAIEKYKQRRVTK